MLNGEDRNFPVVAIDGDWYRIIPSRFPPIGIYDRVIANDRLDRVVAVEDITNPRLRAVERLTGGVIPVDPSSPLLQNWNLAPFSYPNPEGSTFIRPRHSCLELGDSLQTALAVSVKKRELFLQRTAEPAIVIEMRAIKTPVTGKFIDLRGVSQGLPARERWAIGDAMIGMGCDGAIFHRPERPHAVCILVLSKAALGRSQQSQHFKFFWNGDKITAIIAFGDVSEISPDDLGKSDSIIAA